MIKSFYDAYYNSDLCEMQQLRRDEYYKSKYIWMLDFSSIGLWLSLFCTALFAILAACNKMRWRYTIVAGACVILFIILGVIAYSIVKDEFAAFEDPKPEYHEYCENMAKNQMNTLYQKEPEVFVVKKLYPQLTRKEILIYIKIFGGKNNED